MLRPEVIKQLESPAMGLATSWAISRRSVPCRNLEEVRDAFKRKYWPFEKDKVAKNNEKAISLREQGNLAYKTTPKDADRAMEYYNKSICMAVEDSEELGIGYANRSAVYFNRKMYRECLENIRLAKEHHYPERLMNKLIEREERCLENIALSNENPEEAETGEKHCSLKSCLEMSDDGKGIRTSCDLSAGEKVLLEKPFLLVVEPELAYKRCDYCGKNNNFNLRPCTSCTAVMYCSENCQEQALQRYHQFECEIVDELKLLFRGPKANRLLHLSLRLFWHGVLLYLEDPETFPQRCENRAELVQYRNPFTLEPSDYFFYLYLKGSEKLASKERSTEQVDLTGICVTQFATVLIYYLAVEENTSLVQRFEGKEAGELLRKLLFALVYQASDLADHRPEETTCFYPFSRLIRHSCAPTAERFLHNFQTMVVLKRPVLMGQEITIAYDEKLTTDRTTKEKRLEKASSGYNIQECNCEGCKSDYPLLKDIEKDEALSKELETIRVEANEVYQRNKLAEFLDRYDNQYPKQELVEAWNMYREFILKDL
ncbi:hypothetical protein ZHAS_00018179 [Anopheles sinensis]|uniref:MYND-type domain-containing protein n=1 Tax=Anopheles sinensis TaxID=74873 RepID=A0A084WIS9_ANOSI|nr:hypothetical protein ZHAS_00018179 [Anopheles sinensis]